MLYNINPEHYKDFVDMFYCYDGNCELKKYDYTKGSNDYETQQQEEYLTKYLKYKNKYLKLKNKYMI